MTHQTQPRGQQATIDQLPPDRRTNLPNGATVYAQRESGWFMAVDGVLHPYQPQSGRGRLIALIVVLAAIVVGIIALVVVRTIQKGPMFGGGPTLTAAEKSCNDGRTDARLGDGGKTLVINSSGDAIKSIVDVQTVACLLDYLKTPEAVRAHIEGTRALDGRQTDSWDGFRAAWTYHPDDGLDITIEQQ